MLYQDDGHILIGAGGLWAKVLAKTPPAVLNLLLVVAVAFFEGGNRFSNILPPTPGTTGKIYDISTVTSKMMFDWICLLCISALKVFPFLQNRTTHFTFVALKTPRVVRGFNKVLCATTRQPVQIK